MAQNVTIAGASYSAVPSISVPKTGGGTASFVDTTDATATANDIAEGKTAYVNGEKITGTSTGGSISIVETTDVGGGTVIEIDANVDIVVEPITITENGVTIAPSGKAYNQITTNVSGGVPEVTIATSGAVVATLDPNKAYHFTSDAITSLTISFSGTQAEQYHFDFISPATAVQLTLPSFVTMEQYFSVEANTKLEIDIANGYGVYAEWAYEVT